MSEAPEEVWADACDGLDLAEADDGVDRWWVSRSPSARFCTAYRRADTVVDKAVAEKMAETLKVCSERFHMCLLSGGSDEEFADIAVQDYRDLIATYEDATEEG